MHWLPICSIDSISSTLSVSLCVFAPPLSADARRPCPCYLSSRLIAPAYLKILPPGSQPLTDLDEFLDLLARRLGMLRRGGVRDTGRAAVWFVQWWRNEGGLAAAASQSTAARGWGFDFQWDITTLPATPLPSDPSAGVLTTSDAVPVGSEQDNISADVAVVQARMEACIDRFERGASTDEEGGMNVSKTQEKKKVRTELLARRKAKSERRWARKSAGA